MARSVVFYCVITFTLAVAIRCDRGKDEDEAPENETLEESKLSEQQKLVAATAAGLFHNAENADEKLTQFGRQYEALSGKAIETPRIKVSPGGDPEVPSSSLPCDFRLLVDQVLFSTAYISQQRELGDARISLDRYWQFPGHPRREQGVDNFCHYRECDARGAILANGAFVTTFVVSFKKGKHSFTAPGTTDEGMYEVNAGSSTRGNRRRAALIELAKHLKSVELEPCGGQFEQNRKSKY